MPTKELTAPVTAARRARGPIALQLQLLSGPALALALLHIAAVRAEHVPVKVGDVLALYDALRLPRPANLSATLRRLADRDKVRHLPPGWQITPLGEQEVRTILGGVDLDRLPIEQPRLGAEFAHAHHDLVPPELAPAAWQPAIGRLLDRAAFERNVVLLGRVPRERADPLHAAHSAIRAAAAAHGLHVMTAADGDIDRHIGGHPGADVGRGIGNDVGSGTGCDADIDGGSFADVLAHAWACAVAIVVVEDTAGRGLVQNLLVELGALLVTGRRCCVLVDRGAPPLPACVPDQHRIDLHDPGAVAAAVHLFASRDLGLPRCAECHGRVVSARPDGAQ